MIYSHTEEIILLYSSDGRATLHEPETMKGHPTTKVILDRWRRWFEILNEIEENPALKTAVEQAEFIYDLCRDNR
jgi:hypothetical protein